MTLSANVTKRVLAPTGDAEGSVKQNKGKVGHALTKLIFGSQDSRVSKRPVRSTGAAIESQTSRTQTETSSEHTGYREATDGGSSTRPKYRRVPSSDFGDDSFDDLLSPSALLDEVVENTVSFPDATNRRTTEEKDESNIFDELLCTIDSPSAEVQSQHHRAKSPAVLVDMTQQNTQSNSPSPYECGTDIDSPMSHNSFSDTEAQPNFENSIDLTNPSAQKRKYLPDDKEDTEKRLKHCTQSDILNKESETVVPELTPYNQTLVNLQTQSPPPVQKGWEDIDPILLDEFKDIVNFF